MKNYMTDKDLAHEHLFKAIRNYIQAQQDGLESAYKRAAGELRAAMENSDRILRPE